MNPWIWVTILLIGGPYFIGFILYLLMRPKEPMIRCSKCYAKIVQTSMYCPHCGSKVTLPNGTRVSKPSSKSLIVAIVCMVAALLISMAATIFYFNPVTTHQHSGSVSETGVVESTSIQWTENFHHLKGTTSKTFTARSEQTNLVYSSKIKKGKVRFEVYNDKDSLLRFIPQNQNEWLKAAFLGQAGTSGSIGGLIDGEKYTVKVIAQNATGTFSFEMKDNY
jgi:hypothetical protein